MASRLTTGPEAEEGMERARDSTEVLSTLFFFDGVYVPRPLRMIGDLGRSGSC
jgi:hypothetical protein